jgi:hypothetical protein
VRLGEPKDRPWTPKQVRAVTRRWGRGGGSSYTPTREGGGAMSGGGDGGAEGKGEGQRDSAGGAGENGLGVGG